MELFKRYLVLRDGGAGGGDSIDIDQGSVTAKAAAITAQGEAISKAFSDAQAAVDLAIAQFLPGDSNKANLDKVLNNGTKDISEAINTINDFADKLAKSSSEWQKAEEEIAAALATALASAGNN